MLIVQLIIDGLAIGGLYALIALAMVIIYKTSEVPNFAQGEMAMVSTFVAYACMESAGLPFPAALACALGFACLLGIAFEFCILRRAKEPSVLNLILITLGFERVLYGFAGWKWGAEQKHFPSSFAPLPLSESAVINFGGAQLSQLKVIIVGAALALIVFFFLFFKYSRVGIAMKATQQNRMAARINGIRTNRVISLTWALSSLVGALAGILLVPGTSTSLDASIMLAPLLKGFAAAVLGGMTTFIGAIGGGFVLGIIEKLFGFYVSSEFETVVSFAIIVLILWFRPEGLFGRKYVKKV